MKLSLSNLRIGFASIVIGVQCVTSAIAVDLGKPAPDFDLPSAQQENIKLAAYRGKVVYLDFWASWCVPCRETFPFMNQLRKKFANDGLEIVAVNIDTKRQDADKFLASIPAEFTVLYDPKRGVAKAYALKGLPTTFLIDRDGNLISTHLGFQKDRADELEAHIAKILADPAKK